MKVLFIGGTGEISEAVSRLAVKKGIDLYLFNRGNNKEFMPQGAKLIEGDIYQEDKAADILADYSFDVVVDWIAFGPENIKRDIRLFRDKTEQYIFISSASVYQKPPTDYLITESTPLHNPYLEYARNKIACERVLREEYRQTGFPMTIVRPSHTYGRSSIPAAINSFSDPWSLVERMRRGKKVVVHGDGTSLWTITHNTDFARAFIGLLGNQKAVGHAFHITAEKPLNWNQITETVGKAAGVEPEIAHLSSDLISEFMPNKRGSLLGDKAWSLVFDNSKIKRFVPEYEIKVPFMQGMNEAIKWFEAHPKKCSVDQEWNQKMDQLVTMYENLLNKKD